ncbi:MAG: hypothetical protein J6C44_02585 [Muribaculaceae bacterium]|nr:hypothetical protein [Muribaculaceae bacterium]
MDRDPLTIAPSTPQTPGGIMSTEVFTPGASAYMTRVARRWLSANLWWVIALPAAMTIASLWESVFIFIALMVTFLLYPGVLMMVYYRYALDPWSRLAVYPQQITVNGNTVIRSFIPSDNFPNVPDTQHLTVKTGSRPYRSGRFMVADIDGKSRYEFIMWPADNDMA